MDLKKLDFFKLDFFALDFTFRLKRFNSAVDERIIQTVRGVMLSLLVLVTTKG